MSTTRAQALSLYSFTFGFSNRGNHVALNRRVDPGSVDPSHSNHPFPIEFCLNPVWTSCSRIFLFSGSDPLGRPCPWSRIHLDYPSKWQWTDPTSSFSWASNFLHPITQGLHSPSHWCLLLSSNCWDYQQICQIEPTLELFLHASWCCRSWGPDSSYNSVYFATTWSWLTIGSDGDTGCWCVHPLALVWRWPPHAHLLCSAPYWTGCWRGVPWNFDFVWQYCNGERHQADRCLFDYSTWALNVAVLAARISTCVLFEFWSYSKHIEGIGAASHRLWSSPPSR